MIDNNDPTFEATKRWHDGHVATANGGLADHRPERKLEEALNNLIGQLYESARCGEGGAEFNLVRDGYIEMIQNHVAGLWRETHNWWRDCRWAITAKGQRASTAELTKSILRDPPLEVAQADADEEADIIEAWCPDSSDLDNWDDTADRRVKWAHLNARVERIKAAA